MYAEAKAVLDAASPTSGRPPKTRSPLVLRAVANIMLGRAEAAQKDLANPAVGNQNDAPLWRALALARQGKWAEARDAFRNVEGALGALPLELQRIALKEALRAAIEVGDFASAGEPAQRFRDHRRVAASSSRRVGAHRPPGRRRSAATQDALAAYRFAAASDDRPAAAQGRLREIALRYSLGETQEARRASASWRTLTTAWRGDETEVEALQMLARLYTEEDRYRDAFHVMRVALTALSQFAADAQHPGRGRRRPSTRCSSPARATRCRRSMRSACSTISAS